MNTIKIVSVGDGAVGKTSLLQTYTTNSFPPDYVPTVFDNYSANVMVDGIVYNLCIWDTAGQEDYEKIRPLTYAGTDIFLVCYAITSKPSFNNIRKWKEELNYYTKNSLMVLVGLKNDLRSTTLDCVDEELSKIYASQNGFVSHYLCSALTQEGIKQLFDDIILLVINNRKKKEVKKCVIL